MKKLRESDKGFKEIDTLVRYNHQVTNPHCWHNLRGETDEQGNFHPTDTTTPEYRAEAQAIRQDLGKLIGYEKPKPKPAPDINTLFRL